MQILKKKKQQENYIYPLSCWTWMYMYPAIENSVVPDQLDSSEANWSGSALFVIQYMNLYPQSGWSNQTGW